MRSRGAVVKKIGNMRRFIIVLDFFWRDIVVDTRTCLNLQHGIIVDKYSVSFKLCKAHDQTNGFPKCIIFHPQYQFPLEIYFVQVLVAIVEALHGLDLSHDFIDFSFARETFENFCARSDGCRMQQKNLLLYSFQLFAGEFVLTMKSNREFFWSIKLK